MFNSFKFLIIAITCCAYLLASKTKLGRRQGDTDSPRESSAPRHQNKAVPAGIWSDFPFTSDPDIFLWPSEEPYFCPMICQETPQDFVLLQALTHLSNTARHKLWCQAPWHSITTCPSIHTSFGIFFHTQFSLSPCENHLTKIVSLIWGAAHFKAENTSKLK